MTSRWPVYQVELKGDPGRVLRVASAALASAMVDAVEIMNTETDRAFTISDIRSVREVEDVYISPYILDGGKGVDGGSGAQEAG